MQRERERENERRVRAMFPRKIHMIRIAGIYIMVT